MIKSLVIGVNGTIGSELFSRLRATNNLTWGSTHKATADKQTFHLNLLDDPLTWELPDIDFDIAYLCAGACRMALCEDDPVTTQHINVIGMGALARRLAQRGTFIVYTSTNQVFSGETPYQLANASYQPLNEYGRQKVAIETVIARDCQSYAIVRLTKVVEKNMSLIKNWIEQLKQQQPINAFRDMVLAPVTLRQLVDLLIEIGEKRQTGYYQISGEQDLSYLDLANYIAQYLHAPNTLINAVNAHDCGIKNTFLPRFTTLDCASTTALTGLKPPHYATVLAECFEL